MFTKNIQYNLAQTHKDVRINMYQVSHICDFQENVCPFKNTDIILTANVQKRKKEKYSCNNTV